MKVKTLIALGLALIAFDAAQASFAENLQNPISANSTYFPAGQTTSPVQTAELPRAMIRAQAHDVSHEQATTWTEFGAGSHDQSLSTQTRAEVSNQARNAAHPATRSYFSY